MGKTELARVLAREVFGGDNSLIKIDMSEFSERHTASQLIGARLAMSAMMRAAN